MTQFGRSHQPSDQAGVVQPYDAVLRGEVMLPGKQDRPEERQQHAGNKESGQRSSGAGRSKRISDWCTRHRRGFGGVNLH